MRSTVISCAVLLMFFLITAPSKAWPQDDGERLNRIEGEVNELKKENQALKNRIDNVEADDEETRHSLGVLSRLVDVSGYADAEYTLTDQKSENSKFRIRHLSLFFTKDIQKEWKLFTEVEFEDAPRIESNTAADTVSRAQGTIFVEQMYIQYHPAINWDVRVGRFLTPAGVWSIYHYPPYVPTQTSPLLYKVIFPEVSDGVQLRNSFSLGNSTIDTHLYLANGSGNPGAADRNENKAVGARANLDVLNGLSAGLSYYREKDNKDVMKNSYGVHLLYDYMNFKFQAEYAIRHNRPVNARSFNDAGSYAQVSYDTGKWTLAGRLDWYDSNVALANTSQFRYTGAVNYHFAHNVVGKAEYNRNTFKDPVTKDFNEAILAIVVAIGDL